MGKKQKNHIYKDVQDAALTKYKHPAYKQT